MSDVGITESVTAAPIVSRPLSRHLSTPHLETFRVTRSASSVTPVNNYVQPYGTQTPMTSFGTFGSTKSKGSVCPIQDDPNPYSVSKIDEFRIQLQNPYRMRTKSTNQISSCSASERSSSAHYYQELEDYDGGDGDNDAEGALQESVNDLTHKFVHLPNFYARSSSGGYEEILDAEGELSGASSEELPPPPSESSEEYHHSLSIATSSGSEGMSPIPRDFSDPEALPSPPRTTPTSISRQDLFRIELALKGRKTDIFVCDSLANLYYLKPKTPGRSNSSSGASTPSVSPGAGTVQNETEDWMLKYTGVPVLLLDTGETKSRDKRKIQLVLAELGSGLALWKDTIDHLSNYSVSPGDTPTFHTMHLSFDHTKVVGLSFDNSDSAHLFWKRIDNLTSDFANISLSGSKHKGKGKDKKKRPGDKWVRPNKKDISQPCAFQHVATLSNKDKGLFSSLQHFVTGKPEVVTPPPSLPH